MGRFFHLVLLGRRRVHPSPVAARAGQNPQENHAHGPDGSVVDSLHDDQARTNEINVFNFPGALDPLLHVVDIR